MTNKWKLILTFVVLGPLLSLIPTGLMVYHLWNWTYQGEPTTFEVHSGESFGRVNARLKTQDLISSPRMFHYYARHKEWVEKLRVGLYEITPGMNMQSILELLVSGKGLMKQFTVAEGKNIYEVAKVIEAAGFGKAEEFLSFANNASFAKDLGIEGPNLEGYLYPETYQFTPGVSMKQIIQTMHEEFQIKTKNLDLGQTDLSWHQVVTMASIVEKETGAGFERAQIAGVFINRLKKKMRLQSDPTTIYGMWSRYKGNIRKDDLLEKTPYNTYQIDGLPPGPICNPGIDSIDAVLHPKEHRFLFFVSFNDGTHKFSETYKEHLQAVEDFQVRRGAREGKSWRDLSPDLRVRK